MRGSASFRTRSVFLSARHPFTATARRARPAIAPESRPARLTKLTEHAGSAAPNDPNIGLAITGCGVGIEALPSPIIAPAMNPPLMITSGLMPKIEVDPETYEVRADGELLTCEPATALPLAQRYFLF